MLGDAGHFKDPSPGQGIGDALRQGERLAEAIGTSLGGSGDPDAPLLDWWAWRDRDAWEMYWFAVDMGAAGASEPLEAAVLQRIAAHRRHVERLGRTLAHDLPPSKLFGPSLLAGGLADALRAAKGRRRQILAETRRLAGVELSRRAARRTLPSADRRVVPVPSGRSVPTAA